MRHFHGKEDIPIVLRILAIGEEKVGKTTFCGTAPDCYFLGANVEGGYKTLLGLDIEGDLIDDWNEVPGIVEKFVQKSRTTKGFFRSFIFDGASFISMLIEMAGEARAFSNKWAMWGWIGGQLRSVMMKLHSTNCHILYTGHTEDVEDANGQVIARRLILAGKRFRRMLPAAVDGIIYMEKRTVVVGLPKVATAKRAAVLANAGVTLAAPADVEEAADEAEGAEAVVVTAVAKNGVAPPKPRKTSVVRSHLLRHAKFPGGFRWNLPPYIDNLDFQTLAHAITEVSGVRVADAEY